VSKKSQLALLSVPIRKVQANSIAPKSNAKQNLKRKLVRHLHKIVHMLCDVGGRLFQEWAGRSNATKTKKPT